MIKTIKVMLVPNNKQNTKLFQFADAARFAYNWAIATEEQNYKDGGKFIRDCELRRRFTVLRNSSDYKWLSSISNNVTKQAIKDACKAYICFFKHKSKHPKFKSRKKSKPSFFQDNIKIKFSETHVKLECLTTSREHNKQKFNWVRLAEQNRIPVGCKYYNPRITFDGLHWWITVGVDYKTTSLDNYNDGLGIDLGVKDLAILSDGTIYGNINKTRSVKKLEKKKHRLQRSISRSYEKNKKGVCYCKTSNVTKKEKKLLKISHRLTDIRKGYIHSVISDIIRREPSFVVMEDLDVSGMMKNRHLSKAVQQQRLYDFRGIMEYKCKLNGIQFILADRWFPSSKLCSCCGMIKKDLKLSDRVYRCECGNIIDRDYQAAINLKMYGEVG